MNEKLQLITSRACPTVGAIKTGFQNKFKSTVLQTIPSSGRR